MRLTSAEISAIRQCTADVFGEGAVVRLFGSRTRDDLRGGDIDLHVTPEREELATIAHKDRFKARLEDSLGEQRIDVVVKAPGAALRAIDRVALANGPLLSGPTSPERFGSSAGEFQPDAGALMEAHLELLGEAVNPGRIVADRLSRTLAALGPSCPSRPRRWPSSMMPR